MTSRNWCFTVNNPDVTVPLEMAFCEQMLDQCAMIVCQMEMSQSQTPHLQGYLEVKVPCRMSKVKKWLPTAHLEKRKGTRAQAILYCLKTETQITNPCVWYAGQWMQSNTILNEWKKQWENLLTQGSGNTSTLKLQLSEIKSKLAEGDSGIIECIADDYFDVWCRYYKAFEKYMLMKSKPRNHVTEVHVLQGPTGTGKSKWAMDNYPKAYWKQRSQWWDGYMNHEVVILDEFYGWLPYDTLLRICDRYPLMVETKGGQVNFVAKVIVITTNSVPNTWYKNVYFPALARRVTAWHVLPMWGLHSTYYDWTEAIKHMHINEIHD